MKSVILLPLLVLAIGWAAAIPTVAAQNSSPGLPQQQKQSPDLPLSGKAWELADQAYKAYATKHYALADRLAGQAIALVPKAPQLYLLRIYALQQRGLSSEAVQVARQAESKGLKRAEFETLLAPASQSGQGSRDTVHVQPPTQTREALARQFAQKAYDAYAANDYTAAISAARQAVAADRDNTDFEQLLTTTLAAGGRQENLEALARLNNALSAQPGNTDWLIQRAYVYQRLGEPAKAVVDFSQARATGEAPAATILDEGFAAASAGDKRQGSALLKEGIEQADRGTLDLSPAQRLDLRKNISNLEREWGAYVSVGYRGARAATSGLGGSPSAALGDAIFSTAEVFWRPSDFLNTSTRVFEAYGRVSNTLHDQGADVAESFDSCGNRYPADSYRSVGGFPSTMGALGLRFTPSTDIGVTFGLERRFNLGSRSRLGSATPSDCSLRIPGKEFQTKGYDGDWLAYATYAYYKGTELRHGAPSWWRIEGYAQAGYLWNDTSAEFRDSGAPAFDQSGEVKRRHHFASGELRVGRSVRMDAINPNLILYPHIVAAADWQNENSRAWVDGVGSFAMQGNGRSWSTGVGAGLGVRYWFRSDHYGSARSYVDWTVQFRTNVGGGAKDRSEGLFMNMTMSW